MKTVYEWKENSNRSIFYRFTEFIVTKFELLNFIMFLCYHIVFQFERNVMPTLIRTQLI